MRGTSSKMWGSSKMKVGSSKMAGGSSISGPEEQRTPHLPLFRPEERRTPRSSTFSARRTKNPSHLLLSFDPPRRPSATSSTTEPMSIFDPIFGSEDRRWGGFFEDGGGSLRNTPSSKNHPHLRRTSPSSKNAPSLFFDSEYRSTPHFRFSEPKIEEGPIFNLRSSAPNIEENPFSIFDAEEWVEDRTEEGGVLRRWRGILRSSGSEERRTPHLPLFRVEERRTPRSSTFLARKRKNTPTLSSSSDLPSLDQRPPAPLTYPEIWIRIFRPIVNLEDPSADRDRFSTSQLLSAIRKLVESKTRTYPGRVGAGRHTAGRRGGAGPGRMRRRRDGSPKRQPAACSPGIENTCPERLVGSTNTRKFM